MNPSFFGAVGATLLVALWLLTRRRPRPFLRSADTSAVAALNRAQLALVAPAAPSEPVEAAAETAEEHAGVAAGEAAADTPLPAAADARGRRLLLRRLAAQAEGDAAQRLEAMRIARRWRNRAVLPLLRRGLRDVHPAVVEEAARAIAAYRGRPAAATPPAGTPAAATPAVPASRPRRVSRTR
jgi:hypothetical protein